MLSKMEQTKEQWSGKHQALDSFLNARQSLLVDYIHLSAKQKTLPTQEELQEFCGQLVDYVSAGHFEIYDYVVAAFEAAQGDARLMAERIYPSIKQNTEEALYFHDKYAEAADEDTLLELDQDLNRLGEVLEERFELEDKMVSALNLLARLNNEQPA